GGAVVERHPQLRVGHVDLETALGQLQVADHVVVEQADDVRARADHVAVVVEGLFQGARAAESVARFEDEHALARTGEVSGAGQAVVPATDDDDVPGGSRQLGDRGGQADLAELVGDRVHVVPAWYARATRVTNWYTPSSSLANGPG